MDMYMTPCCVLGVWPVASNILHNFGERYSANLPQHNALRLFEVDVFGVWPVASNIPYNKHAICASSLLVRRIQPGASRNRLGCLPTG